MRTENKADTGYNPMMLDKKTLWAHTKAHGVGNVANRLGVTVQTLRSWVRDGKRIPFSAVGQICQIVGIPPEQVVKF